MKCRKGLHEMTEDNTKLDRHGRRHCRACTRERKSGYHAGSLGVGRRGDGTTNSCERETAKAMEANPPEIVWRRRRGGIYVAVYVKDPHAERGSKQRQPDIQVEYVDCTDPDLLAAARTEL
jgi:hypothetical protein